MKPSLNHINTIADGDTHFIEKLIAIAKKEFPEEKNTLLTTYRNKEYQLCAAAVHKLKHKLNLFDMPEAYQHAVILESTLKEEKTADFEEFLKIIDILEAYINSL